MAELNEVVAEAAETVASEAIQVVTKTDARIVAGVAIIGLGVGAVASYFWTKKRLEKRLEKHYEEVAEEEISQMREHFRKRLLVREQKPDLASGELATATEELGYASPTGPKPSPPEADPTAIEPRPPVPVPPRPSKPNAIHEALEDAQNRDPMDAAPPDGWDWDEEKANRNERIPYVIHVDERGEADFDQVTYTYYEGDDVVCDERNSILQPVDEVVGNHNLGRFGHGGTEDPNVVYLRNEHLALEIELVRDSGSYTEEVRGIQHSDGGVERRRRPSREDQ